MQARITNYTWYPRTSTQFWLWPFAKKSLNTPEVTQKAKVRDVYRILVTNHKGTHLEDLVTERTIT